MLVILVNRFFFLKARFTPERDGLHAFCHALCMGFSAGFLLPLIGNGRNCMEYKSFLQLSEQQAILFSSANRSGVNRHLRHSLICQAICSVDNRATKYLRVRTAYRAYEAKTFGWGGDIRFNFNHGGSVSHAGINQDNQQPSCLGIPSDCHQPMKA